MATLSQLPDPVDLAFVAGDTFRIRVRVLNPNDDNPMLLDDYRFLSEIAKPDHTVVSAFDVTPDPDNPTTAVILSLSAAETKVLPGMVDGRIFNGIWDLEVTFPLPEGETDDTKRDVRTVATGTVTCVIDVSDLPKYPATS